MPFLSNWPLLKRLALAPFRRSLTRLDVGVLKETVKEVARVNAELDFEGVSSERQIARADIEGTSIEAGNSAPHPPTPSPRKRGEGEMKVGLSGRAFGDMSGEMSGEMSGGASGGDEGCVWVAGLDGLSAPSIFDIGGERPLGEGRVQS